VAFGGAGFGGAGFGCAWFFGCPWLFGCPWFARRTSWKNSQCDEDDRGDGGRDGGGTGFAIAKAIPAASPGCVEVEGGVGGPTAGGFETSAGRLVVAAPREEGRAFGGSKTIAACNRAL
jgi:hypothetical protein